MEPETNEIFRQMEAKQNEYAMRLLNESGHGELQNILSKWSYSFDKAGESAFSSGHHLTEEEKEIFGKEWYWWSSPEYNWDKIAMSNYSHLHRCLWTGIGSDKRLQKVDPLSESEYQKLSEQNFEPIKELLRDETFEAHGELVKFLSYELWLSSRYISNSRGLPDTVSPAVTEFENKKMLLQELFVEATKTAAANDSRVELKTIFEGFSNVESLPQAQELVLIPELSDQQRLAVTVEYCNVFGFIETINFLAEQSRNLEHTPELRAQIKKMYHELEGDKENKEKKHKHRIGGSIKCREIWIIGDNWI